LFCFPARPRWEKLHLKAYVEKKPAEVVNSAPGCAFSARLRQQIKKPRLNPKRGFFMTEFWCRLPVSNWPPDDYKSSKIPVGDCVCIFIVVDYLSKFNNLGYFTYCVELISVN
jgi:hypothetical protein